MQLHKKLQETDGFWRLQGHKTNALIRESLIFSVRYLVFSFFCETLSEPSHSPLSPFETVTVEGNLSWRLVMECKCIPYTHILSFSLMYKTKQPTKVCPLLALNLIFLKILSVLICDCVLLLYCRGHNDLKDEVISCLGSIGQVLGIDCDK